MFRFLNKDVVFFDLFEGLAAHMVCSAGLLHALALGFPNIQAEMLKIREEEHQADELAHQALERLDRSTFTPFARGDIHTLVGELDTVVDNINALAKRVGMYHVKTMEPAFIKQTTVLLQATTVLRDAVYMLRSGKGLADIHEKLVEVHRLENLGDDNHLAAVSNLYDGSC